MPAGEHAIIDPMPRLHQRPMHLAIDLMNIPFPFTGFLKDAQRRRGAQAPPHLFSQPADVSVIPPQPG